MTDSKVYYQVNVVPFIVMELEEKFSNLVTITANILKPVPSVLCSDTFNVNFEQVKSKYEEYPPHPLCTG